MDLKIINLLIGGRWEIVFKWWIGNFTEVEFNTPIRLQYINQYDEDIENEIIYVTNKFDSRYQTENEAKIVFIDKIDDSFVETKSDDIFITQKLERVFLPELLISLFLMM